MKIRLLTLLVFVLAMIGSVESQDFRLGKGQQAAQSKIASWVMDNTVNGNVAEFLVVLADQADLSGAAALRTKEEKGRFVYETLYNKAKSTQGPILAWLQERNVEHRSYYIVNMIWVKGDRQIAMALAARADVASVEGNPQIRNIPDQPIIETAPQTTEPLAVGANITNTRAPEVWAMGFTGQGIVVAGADTGYRWDHTAIQGKYRGWNGATASHDFNWHDSIHSGGGSCGANSAAPCDDNGHGTHTMGTVLGDDGGVNQVGMAPGARWIGCRNMNQGVGTPATYIECFEFFLAPYPVSGTPAQGDPAKAPHVTSNSWGCPPSEGCSANTLQAAVEAQRAAGIMTVVAAGNSGSSCSTVSDPPAIYDASYTVGAFSHTTGSIAGFSSRGPVVIDSSLRLKPDITAPGVSINSCTRTTTTSYSSAFSGTSMATPHVAGAFALLWSAVPSLRGQMNESEAVLNNSAVHVTSTSCDAGGGTPNNVWGNGKLDIKAAVDSQLAATISPTSQLFSSSGGEGMINVTAASGVNWTAVSNDAWIIITSASGGTGNGVVSYLVRDNMTAAPRQGTLTVAGKTFTVIQNGPSGSCDYKLTPKFNGFTASGGTGSIDLSVEASCAWKAVSNASWITVTSGCCGIGPATITYSVAANPGPSARNGTISVAGQIFSVKQKGP